MGIGAEFEQFLAGSAAPPPKPPSLSDEFQSFLGQEAVKKVAPPVVPGMERLGALPGPAAPPPLPDPGPIVPTAEEANRIEYEATKSGNKALVGQMAEYSPIKGVPQMIRGGEVLARAAGRRPVPTKEAVQGARDVIQGAGKTAAPLAIPALVAAPVATVAGVVGGMAVQKGTEAGLEAVGVPEDVAGLAGDVAGLIPPGAAAKHIYGRALELVRANPKGVGARRLATDLGIPEEQGRAIVEQMKSEGAVKPGTYKGRAVYRPVSERPQKSVAETPQSHALPQRVEPIEPSGTPAPDASSPVGAETPEPAVAPQPAREVAPAEPPPTPGKEVIQDPTVTTGSGAVPEAYPVSEARLEGQRGSFSNKPKAPVEEDHFNFKRVALSSAEEANLRAEVAKTVQEQGLDPKAVEPHAAVVEAARSIDPDLVAQVSSGSRAGIQNRAARQAMRQRMNSLNREVVAGRERLAKDADRLPQDEAMKLETEINQKEEDLKRYIGEWAGIRSNDGRNLAMHRIMADSTWDVGYWIQKARRSKGLPPGAKLPTADDAAIRTIIAEGEAATTPEAKAAARKKLAETVTRLEKSGWIDTLTALRKAGLLTGIKTHLRNVGGNSAFQAMEEVAKIPASMVDIALSTFSGQRSVAGASIKGIAKASAEAATKGMREAGQILRKGASAEDLAKVDALKEFNGPSKVLNAYINGVFRTLSAEDRVFRSFAYRRSIEAQAKVIAMNEARAGQGKALTVPRRANEIAANPTEAMNAQAIADAEFATFNNDNVLASAVQRGKATLPPSGRFAADMVVPFVRTPANVIARLFDYTPVGGAARIGAAAKKQFGAKALTPEIQRAYSMAVGRGATGTALMLLGWHLASKGLATGTGQSDPGQRGTAEAAGRQPGAVLVGGNWQRISPFAPGGNLITIGATLWQEGNRRLKDEAKRPGNMAKVATRTVLEQPMLQGAQEVIEALENPEAKGERVLASQVGSFVPTIVSDVGSLTDDRRREPAKGAGIVTAAKEGVQARIPGWRNSLPEKKNVLGEPLESKKSSTVNPFLSSTAKEGNDPALAEAIRLQVGISKPQKKAGEPQESYDERLDQQGKAIRRALDRVSRSPYFRNLRDDDKKREFMQKQIEDARRIGSAIAKRRTRTVSK